MVSRGDAMKTVVVTGSRKWSEPAPLRAALRGADVLIVGDCPPDRTTRSSAYSLALSIALRWDVVAQVFAASPARAEFLRNKGIHVELVSDWERDGNSAGPTRNTAIADAARRARLLGEVRCHAFPQPGSVGTYDCIRKLRAAELDVDVFRGAPNTPSHSAHAAAALAAPELLLFWGHKPFAPGVIGPECLSQWYPAPFVISGDRFPTAEHYMMHRKALLFGDSVTAASILRCGSAASAKELGRSVRAFDERAWNAHRMRIVVEGNLAKFIQNKACAAYLLGTQPALLVEASPYDRIWGIGLGPNDPRARDPRQWRGDNQLGNALMAVRAQLLERERASELSRARAGTIEDRRALDLQR